MGRRKRAVRLRVVLRDQRGRTLATFTVRGLPPKRARRVFDQLKPRLVADFLARLARERRNA